LAKAPFKLFYSILFFHDRTVGISSYTKDISRRLRINAPAYVYDADDDFDVPSSEQQAIASLRTMRRQHRHDEVSVIENVNTTTATNTSATIPSPTLVLPSEAIPSASAATSPKRTRNAFVSSDDESNNNTNHKESGFTTPTNKSKRARIIDLGRDDFDDVGVFNSCIYT
jgi:hypothetical protein